LSGLGLGRAGNQSGVCHCLFLSVAYCTSTLAIKFGEKEGQERECRLKSCENHTIKKCRYKIKLSSMIHMQHTYLFEENSNEHVAPQILVQL